MRCIIYPNLPGLINLHRLIIIVIITNNIKIIMITISYRPTSISYVICSQWRRVGGAEGTVFPGRRLRGRKIGDPKSIFKAFS